MNVFIFFVFLLFCSNQLLPVYAQECLPDADRIDCHPDPEGLEEGCLARGCIWCEASAPDNTPWCYYPRNYGYKMVGEPMNTGHGFMVQLQRNTNATMFGNEINDLTVEVDFQSDYRLRVKITDREKPRWEVPIQIDAPKENLTDNPLYEVKFVNEPIFSFKVIRKESGTVIFDSALPGLVFSDQFIQMGWKLPSKNVYGIGENEQHTLRHTFDHRRTFALWSNSWSPIGDLNVYGVQPHYTVVEEDGNSHVVVVMNSNAQEFEMHPGPAIVYRTIGGILDLYFFLGPTPENTAQQYTEAVGRYPLPPYWSLGFQICKFGYNTLENLKEVVDRMIAAEIPYDVQYGDIDIMDGNRDFTVSPDRFAGLGDYVKEIKSKGIKFVTILDPFITTFEPRGTYRPYELGQEMDVWMKRSDGTTPVRFNGWPGENCCYLADYSKNSTKEWWRLMIKEFHDLLEFDGLWIDFNEPSNGNRDGDAEEGCQENNLNFPPYVPRIRDPRLFTVTICPDHKDSVDIHYNTHNLYSYFEAEPTLSGARLATGKRSFAFSRATYLGIGRWVTHRLGDNFSTWENMRWSIIGMLQHNLFGIPFNGPDICGHNWDVSVELCQRWMELGAFYPFSRNHATPESRPQDPAAFDGEIIESSKKALNVRYTLLPYLYTLLARHENYGDTVARAMWGVFPNDIVAWEIDRQFFWGSGILITPVLFEGNVTVEGYFPDSRFYDYYTGEEVAVRGNHTVLGAPREHINVHVHGGNIIPTQEPAVNTDISKNNPFGLIVALDDDGKASGSFFFDDGDSIDTVPKREYFAAEMTAENKVMTFTPKNDGYPEMANKIMGSIRLLGVNPSPTKILVNGNEHSSFTVLPSKEVLVTDLNLKANEGFVLTYE